MVNTKHDDSNTIEARNHNYVFTKSESRISESSQTQNNSKLRAQINEFLPKTFKRTVKYQDAEDREVTLDIVEMAEGSVPIVQQINLCENSRVHFGAEFVTVDENLFTEGELKQGTTGLLLKTPKNNSSIRCGFVIFVCCSLIVGSGLAHYYVIHEVLPRQVMDLGLQEWWYFRRSDWQAMPRHNVAILSMPIRFVIIGHSESDSCESKSDCIEELQAMQFYDRYNRSYDDIGPNFIITREGFVFEGRGANVEGNMVKYYDDRSITIQFLGDYRTIRTVPAQFEHLNQLLRELVKKDVLVRNHQIVGHCQLNPTVSSPGVNIMYELGNLAQWWPQNSVQCIKK